jgi:hypothetical protein
MSAKKILSEKAKVGPSQIKNRTEKPGFICTINYKVEILNYRLIAQV